MNKKFITYVRTKQFLELRLKGGGEFLQPVHIPQKEIENRFFVYPQYNRKESLRELVEAQELKIHRTKQNNKRNYLRYEALKNGELDFSLIEQKKDNFSDSIIKEIRKQLKYVSLRPGAPSTPYFDAFLLNKDKFINLFFTVDSFARRIHTPVTNFHREYRSNILFHNNEVASLDVATMQPLLLGKILSEKLGENEYSNWINSGEDIYLMLQKKANLETRDQAKKRFFEILFAPPSQSLSDIFGTSDWINWINEFKKRKLEQNPHNKEKRYSNLAWLLQSTEVQIMYKVWKELTENNISFLTIHDEILIERRNGETAKIVFENVLRKEFKYFKLNSKIEKPKPVTKDWSNEITELENYFSNIELPNKKIKLNDWSTILNCQLFINSHLATVKNNNGNKTFLPYLERLQNLKNIVETKNLF